MTTIEAHAYPTGALFRHRLDSEDVFIVAFVFLHRRKVKGVAGTRAHLVHRSLTCPTLTHEELSRDWVFSHMAKRHEPNAYTMILEAE